MTTVYLIRHSQAFRNLLGDYKVNELEQIKNEKNPLSVIGEERAKKLASSNELLNIDVLYSSHYVRAMSTAKYIAENNNILLNVDERLGERRFGVNSMDELPKTFYEDQFRNWDYKIEKGESISEVSTRMYEALIEILNRNKNKRIAIVSHSTAISSLLSKWCYVGINEDTKLIEIHFNNNKILDTEWNCPDLFKLEFDDNNNILSIQHIV